MGDVWDKVNISLFLPCFPNHSSCSHRTRDKLTAARYRCFLLVLREMMWKTVRTPMASPGTTKESIGSSIISPADPMSCSFLMWSRLCVCVKVCVCVCVCVRV